jgi:hypothetical protein
MSLSGSSSNDIIIPPDSSEEWLSDGTIETFLAAYEALEDTASSTFIRGYVKRFRDKALENLMNDYFVEQPKFNEDVFHDRFRISKRLYLQIVNDIVAQFEWFQEGQDAYGKTSFTALQKFTSAIRQLATGEPPDRFDDYLNMTRRTSGY